MKIGCPPTSPSTLPSATCLTPRTSHLTVRPIQKVTCTFHYCIGRKHHIVHTTPTAHTPTAKVPEISHPDTETFPSSLSQHKHHNASPNHPTSNSNTALQLARLVQPTAPAPPHRRNSLLGQDRADLLPRELRAAVDRSRRPQALDPLVRVETQQRGRERASDGQLRRQRGDLAAMGGGRWK